MLVLKKQSFDGEWYRTTSRRIKRFADQIFSESYDDADPKTHAAFMNIMICGDWPQRVESILQHVDKAKEIALAIASLPPTRAARRKAEEKRAANIFQITNERDAISACWLN